MFVPSNLIQNLGRDTRPLLKSGSGRKKWKYFKIHTTVIIGATLKFLLLLDLTNVTLCFHNDIIVLCKSWLKTQHSKTKTMASGPISQFSLVAQSCPTICYPMYCSMPAFHAHHQLLEFTQTRVHWVGDAIQPSHPLSSPSPPDFNLSQHQGLFQ